MPKFICRVINFAKPMLITIQIHNAELFWISNSFKKVKNRRNFKNLRNDGLKHWILWKQRKYSVFGLYGRRVCKRNRPGFVSKISFFSFPFLKWLAKGTYYYEFWVVRIHCMEKSFLNCLITTRMVKSEMLISKFVWFQKLHG